MQDISTIFFSGIIESSDALISGVRDISRRMSIYFHNGLNNLPGRMHRAHCLPPASLESRHEVAIMYAGHASESLRVTSERMVIPDGCYTLGQLLCSLYKRGDRWAEELDDGHLVCTVNGREAKLFDTIEAGAEVRISS
jgi:molybdopterin converting factor small subunit